MENTYAIYSYWDVRILSFCTVIKCNDVQAAETLYDRSEKGRNEDTLPLAREIINRLEDGKGDKAPIYIYTVDSFYDREVWLHITTVRVNGNQEGDAYFDADSVGRAHSLKMAHAAISEIVGRRNVL